MTRSLKVVHFTDNYGPGSNGQLVAVQQLEGNLLDAGHQVVVVAPQANGPNPHAGRPGRSEIRLPSVWVPRMPTRVANGRHFERTIQAIQHELPDVLHIHGAGPVGVLGMWAAKRLGIPTILTWHTDFDAYASHYSVVLPFLSGVLKAFARISRGEAIDDRLLRTASERFQDRGRSAAPLLGLAQQMLESATLVTTPSPKTITRCRLLTSEARIICVPNGVDPLPAGPPPLRRGDGPLIMYAGRIAPEKGIDLLVEAFELLRAQNPDAQLLIVGDWRRYPKIRRMLERAKRHGNVWLPGEQPRERLGAYYALADVFAFPSQTDTQALVLHEAALAGLPIVSVDAELRLVVEPGINGDIARPTPHSLAVALSRVLWRLPDTQWRARASARSIELASQWSAASQAARMLELYDLVASGRVDEIIEEPC